MKPGLTAALLINSLLLATSLPAAEDEQWVRVKHPTDIPALKTRDLSGRLADYGSFQWGRLKREQIEQLKKMGLSVAIERNPFELTLGGERFDPIEIKSPARVDETAAGGDFHLVQFKGPIRKKWLQSLRERGIEIVQPLHPFSYVVWASSTNIQAAQALPAMRWSGPMRTEWKVPPSQRFTGPGRRPTMALASAHFDPDRLAAELERFGRVHSITSLGRHYRIVQLDADGPDYSSIADIPGILTVQHIPPEAGPRGEMSNQSIVGAIDETGAIQSGYRSWLDNTGYDGSGIIIGVVDGAVRTTHQDLAERIAPCTGANGSCDAATASNHGTHVAGAVAGTGATGILDGNGFLRGQGVAPGAGIVSQRYDPFLGAGPGGMVADGMLKIYQDSARSGALLTNNSWGPTGSPQGYDIPTQQIDYISRDADPDTPGNQPVLAVWSIMNGQGDDDGACAPSSLGSPDEAKNLFAVGSTWLQDSSGSQHADIFGISFNSAHGPACDGRRVPHIVAPGCATDSTTAGGDTAHDVDYCGTSMAAPVVSGAIAVWAEKYVNEKNVAPSPALTKAVFTAAARDLVGETNADSQIMGHRPDRYQGYGRLDLDAVMNDDSPVLLYDQKTVFDDSGQHWSLEFEAEDPGNPVRIMLAWTDAPGHGLGGETPAWVNNLDLSLDADGYTYLGNVIGPDGWSEAGGTADERNNLEGLFLRPDQLGPVMTVKVIASTLAGDALNPYDPGNAKQDFAFVCHNCKTYTVAAETAELEACIPRPGDEPKQHQVAVNLASIGDYGGEVDLNTSGTPDGVSQTLEPERTTLPGSSTWTLTVDDTATPDESTVFVEGDDGKLQNSDRLTLDLDHYLEAAPSEPSPSNGAELDDLRPTFSWSALSDANNYRIQIADDSSFGNIVFEERVDNPSFTPADDLKKWSSYYWRVRGINTCGEGEWSETFSLGTGLFGDSFEARD